MNYIVPNYNKNEGLESISNPKEGELAKITDSKLGGDFIYDASKRQINNCGTIINGWVRQYEDDINVLWFGAACNGVTDDRDAINNALKYASLVKKDLFFPSGTYQINSGEQLYTIPYGILINNATDIRIYGEKNTLIRTHNTESEGINKWTLFLMQNCKNVTIEGIEFKNNHVNHNDSDNYTTTNEPRGIFVFGKTTENITIRLNTFSGFYRAILLNGGKNTQILENTFLSYNGRDDSAFQTNPPIAFKKQYPAVYIGVVSNSNGINTDIIVKDNYAEGYSGTDISKTQTKRGMDGFYYGYANGATIENNNLLKFGVEAIYCFGFEKYDPNATIKPTTIKGNYIDSTKPEGSLTEINFGIRADGSNYIIEDNHICSGFGVLCYGLENKRVAKNVVVRNNKYVTDTSLENNWKPIFIQGYNKEVFAPAKHYLIENNDITIKGISISNPLYLFTLADAENIQIKNNNLHIENIINTGNHFIAFYKFVKHCRNIDYGLERHNNHFDHITLEGITNSNSNLNYIALESTS